jgi:hypothetical protein
MQLGIEMFLTCKNEGLTIVHLWFDLEPFREGYYIFHHRISSIQRRCSKLVVMTVLPSTWISSNMSRVVLSALSYLFFRSPLLINCITFILWIRSFASFGPF